MHAGPVAVQHFLRCDATRCITIVQRGRGYFRRPRPREGATGEGGPGDGTGVCAARGVGNAVRR